MYVGDWLRFVPHNNYVIMIEFSEMDDISTRTKGAL